MNGNEAVVDWLFLTCENIFLGAMLYFFIQIRSKGVKGAYPTVVASDEVEER